MCPLSKRLWLRAAKKTANFSDADKAAHVLSSRNCLIADRPRPAAIERVVVEADAPIWRRNRRLNRSFLPSSQRQNKCGLASTYFTAYQGRYVTLGSRRTLKSPRSACVSRWPTGKAFLRLERIPINLRLVASMYGMIAAGKHPNTKVYAHADPSQCGGCQAFDVAMCMIVHRELI